MHFVWRPVVERCFQSSAPQSLWQLIDQQLFASHVDNRKYLGFLLLIEFIRRATSVQDLISFLSSPNASRCLVNHTLHQKRSKMGEIALLAISSLTERVSADPALAVALLNGLASPSSPLHALAPLDLGQHILPVLSGAQAASFVRSLLERAVAGGRCDRAAAESLFSALRRGWKRWMAAAEDKPQVPAPLSCSLFSAD
jgi:hypothetical protein